MANIGTGTGQILKTKPKAIAGDTSVAGGMKAPFVSELINYGSYSGADIKTIVHLPYSSKNRTKAGNHIREEIEEINTAIESATGYYEIIRLQKKAEVLRKELDKIKERGYGNTTEVLGNIQTLSWSIFREKSPVRRLGGVYPKTFVRGQRCLPATEKVLVKDKGYISIADVEPGDYVQSSGLTYDKVLGSYDQGIKKCFSVSLSSGYSLTASYDHPVSTTNGWVNIENLKIGDFVHVAASSPLDGADDYPIKDEIIKLVAYLIGDGTTHRYKKKYSDSIEHRIGLSISDSEMGSIGIETEECLKELKIPFKDHRSREDKCISRRISVCLEGKAKTDHRQREYNDLHKTLLEFNLYDRYSHEKTIPQEFISKFSKRQLALFLNRLFSTDGGYNISKDSKYIDVKYTSTSESLIDLVRIMLSKLGINAIKTRAVVKAGQVGGRKEIISRHDSHMLTISKAIDVVRFYERVGIFGKDSRIKEHIPTLVGRINNCFLDVSHKDFLAALKNACKRQNREMKLFSRSFNIYNEKLPISIKKAIKITAEIDDTTFGEYVNHLVRERIEKIEDFDTFKVTRKKEAGYQKVYDLEVENRHAFIANFIRVHNTIAGTMIFTLFNTHVLSDILNRSLSYYNTGRIDKDIYIDSTMLLDQLPPLDISLIFANEYGSISHMGLWGVEFAQEGGTFSIEDMFSEVVVQYVARDLDPLRIFAQRELDDQGILLDELGGRFRALTASQLARDRGTTLRRNPFI